ncbi:MULTISPECIES: hypothetical protein [Variovorax]|uniref:hypothetical protein n=1 Tax=Variovorax TaxID=34072 RepID=UPI002862C98C|nr:hypothetical protein [Variovorax sp. 3319]MDR6887857.1 hypothetical protein [Variovorax sp. 3319]
MRPVPYPADTRAKGWRFELDHERIEQSDTWALAPSDVKPWLLMLWLSSWRQEPCGSLPNEDELIAVRIGMPMKTFAKVRSKLMRGWWEAEDGRLYHDTVTKRVLEMLAAREAERRRKAEYRQRKEAERTGLSRGTDDGHQQDDTRKDAGRDDTGTGTGTSTGKEGNHHHARTTGGSVGGDGQSPTKAGEVCRAIKARKVADVNPSNPELNALIAKGVPVETFEAAADICAKSTPPKGFAYLLGIVKRQLGEAAAIASGVGMPEKPWDENRSTIEAKGEELGLGRWNEHDLSVDRETFPQYTARIRRAVEQRQGVPA